MLAPWVIEEMKDVDLNDKRLNHRLSTVLSQLGGHPTASIPAAYGGYAETTAAYRLFDNEKVGFQNVLQPHIDSTRRRMAEQPVVILVQDTTEIDLTRPQQQVEGVGLLDGAARRLVACAARLYARRHALGHGARHRLDSWRGATAAGVGGAAKTHADRRERKPTLD